MTAVTTGFRKNDLIAGMSYDRFRGRKSLRLPTYDYTAAGAYFVTLCVQDRECLFGDIAAGEMRLNPWGRVARDCWDEIPRHTQGIGIDAFVVMPNHVHGIIVIRGPSDGGDGYDLGGMHGYVAGEMHVNFAGGMHGYVVGGTHASPLRTPPIQRDRYRLYAGSLGAIVGSYKSAVTKRINALRQTPGRPVWQREYHDRIVRDDLELERIRRYIDRNPAQWELDRLNPAQA